MRQKSYLVTGLLAKSGKLVSSKKILPISFNQTRAVHRSTCSWSERS